MLKKMRKKAGALLVMICLGVIILLCWEAGEHLKDKILRSLETAAEARTGKQTVVLDSGHGGSDSGKVGINGAKEKEINLLIAKEIRRLLEKEKIEVIMVREKDEELGKSKVEDLKYRVSLMNEKSRHWQSAFIRTVIMKKMFLEHRFFIIRLQPKEKRRLRSFRKHFRK